MNIVITLLILASLFFYLSFTGDEDKSEPKEAAPVVEAIKPSESLIEETLEKLKSENNQVITSFYNDGGIFNWVVVVNGASSPGSWKGYANALCNTLYDTGVLTEANKADAIEHRLRVVDASKLKNSNGDMRGSSLGSSNCKDFSMSDT